MGKNDNLQLNEAQNAILSNLIYADEITALAGKVDDNYTRSNSLKDRLDYIVNNPAGFEYKDGPPSREEFLKVVNLALQDPQITKLTISDQQTDKNGGKMALFSDDKNATAVFRGTTANEWLMDSQGAYNPNTSAQTEAYDWLNSIAKSGKYSSLNVTGHSGGGNKAMYCGVRIDEIDQVYSFDGQGFTQLFFEQYDDKVISSEHFEFGVTEIGQVWVKDLASLNGTYVVNSTGKRRISDKRREVIAVGDVVHFTKFTAELVEAGVKK